MLQFSSPDSNDNVLEEGNKLASIPNLEQKECRRINEVPDG